MAGARPPRAGAARLPDRRHRAPRVASDGAAQAARLRRLTGVLSEAPVLDVDRAVVGCYGDLRAASARTPPTISGSPPRRLRHDLTLITADERQAVLPLVTRSVRRRARMTI